MQKIQHIRRISDDKFNSDSSYIEVYSVGNDIHVTTTSSKDGARDYGEFEFTLNKEIMRQLALAIIQTLNDIEK